MAVSTKDVMHVARLAKISFTEEEIAQLVKELNSVLEYMEVISGLDVGSIPPTSHVLESVPHVRRDEPKPSLPEGEAIRLAPDSGRGCFKVPRVV
jgi:aspartyl-tRNA(Asn)/glutamyl-tRNA(Gln) amidotransferase subunit C